MKTSAQSMQRQMTIDTNVVTSGLTISKDCNFSSRRYMLQLHLTVRFSIRKFRYYTIEAAPRKMDYALLFHGHILHMKRKWRSGGRQVSISPHRPDRLWT